MTTSVKLGEKAKDRLETLQAEIRLETGRRVTQQELLDRLVSEAYADREAVIDSFREEFDGLSNAECDRWLAGTVDSGTPVDEEGIDDVLYGEDPA